MSNELTTLQLPTHILDAFKSNPAIQSIGEGLVGAHPKIGLGGTNKEFFLKESGSETSLGDSIEILVVGINPNKSITVYGKKFDQNTDPEAPLFSSDDGTPVPGEFSTKIVSESRKWAVLMADNPTGPVYELRVPAASIFRGDTYRDMLAKRGAPIASVVTKITFDKNEKYARFIFAPTAYISVEQASAISKVAGSIEVESVLGVNRKPQRVPVQEPLQLTSKPASISGAEVDSIVNSIDNAKTTRMPRAVKEPSNTLQFGTPKTAAAKVIVNPQPTDTDLDNTIANLLKQ